MTTTTTPTATARAADLEDEGEDDKATPWQDLATSRVSQMVESLLSRLRSQCSILLS